MLAALVVICCIKAGVSGEGKLYDDYMSHERTTSIKGVFAVIIVMSHMLQYITVSSTPDRSAQRIIVAIGQLMVTMFFFYSGYGIVESCRSKPEYIKSFFKSRILKTLVHFDLAVILFIIVNAFMGKTYGIERTLLAFVGWTSIGNSNWFVFCTLALYAVTLLAFGILQKYRHIAIAAVWVLTIALAVILRAVKEDYWWYNTLLCYPLGMLWSEIRKPVEGAMRKRTGVWWAAMLTTLAVFAAASVMMTSKLYKLPLSKYFEWMDLQYFYMFFACIFCLLVVISQMRLRTHNRVLHWLGVNSFSIYILQRIPMRILTCFDLRNKPVLFIPIALAAVLIIAPAFTWLTNKLDKVLFSRKNWFNINKMKFHV